MTHEERARRYLQASMNAGYTGLPAEHKEAYEDQMRGHERAYPEVAHHALVGSDLDFDKALTPGEREHQKHLRDEKGITNAELADARKRLRGAPPAARKQPARRRASSRSAGPRVAAAAASSAAAPISEITGGGNTFMYVIGIMLTLSLIYLLVAGKGSGVITGISNLVVGATRTFVAPVDPIAHAEAALGAGPIRSASSGVSAAPSPAPGSAPSGGAIPHTGSKFELNRKDAGRDVQLQPGAGIGASGSGTVARVASDPSGFGPDYPIVDYTSGPFAGKEVYYGHTDTALPAGSKFNANTILARTSKTGHNAPPGWLEIGYAQGGVPGHVGQPSPF
jgi:hypothetical protein